MPKLYKGHCMDNQQLPLERNMTIAARLNATRNACRKAYLSPDPLDSVFGSPCTDLHPPPHPVRLVTPSRRNRFINHEKIICLTPHYQLKSDLSGVGGVQRVRIICRIALTTKCRLTFDYIRIRFSPVTIIRFYTYTVHDGEDYYDGYYRLKVRESKIHYLRFYKSR